MFAHGGKRDRAQGLEHETAGFSGLSARLDFPPGKIEDANLLHVAADLVTSIEETFYLVIWPSRQ